MCRLAEQPEQRHGGEAADHEADDEAGDDAGEVPLDLLEVEEAAGLAADEDEAELDQDREHHELDH